MDSPPAPSAGFDRRYRLREPLEYQLNKRIPAHLNWTNCFGGVTFVCFILQAFTGILLAFYYKPTLAEAYTSVLASWSRCPSAPSCAACTPGRPTS